MHFVTLLMVESSTSSVILTLSPCFSCAASALAPPGSALAHGASILWKSDISDISDKSDICNPTKKVYMAGDSG